MRGKKAAVTLFAALCITAVLQVGALAHSTYVWYTAARPYHVIPFTFVLSVALEYAALVCIAHAARGSRTLIIVLIGNVLAFGVGGAYYIRSNWGEFPDPSWPPYFVGAIFLCASFVIEVLLEDAALKKYAGGKSGRLIWTLLLANAATAGICALAERLACAGRWGA